MEIGRTLKIYLILSTKESDFMHILMTVFKSILAKYCTAAIIERVVIWGLGVLVQKTESKADDELYEIVFGKLKGDADDTEAKND